MHYLKYVLIAMVVMILLDMLWIGVIAKSIYMTQLGPFLRIKNNALAPNFLAAVVVYVALIAGILIFVIPKSGGDPLTALGFGALFGLVCYAVYDFTNLSVMRDWPLLVTLIDTAWGCVLCGVTSAITVWLGR